MPAKRNLVDVAADRLAKFAMDEGTEDLTMLNTRVPKTLLRTIKIYTVTNGTTIRKFVTEAIYEKLDRLGVK